MQEQANKGEERLKIFTKRAGATKHFCHFSSKFPDICNREGPV